MTVGATVCNGVGVEAPGRGLGRIVRRRLGSMVGRVLGRAVRRALLGFERFDVTSFDLGSVVVGGAI